MPWVKMPVKGFMSPVRWRTHPSQKRHFEGVLHFLIGRDGRLMLVNEADVETIVTSVVPSETFPKADLSFCKHKPSSLGAMYWQILGIAIWVNLITFALSLIVRRIQGLRM